MKASNQDSYSSQELAGDLLDLQSEEILDLCTGDEQGNAVGESENYRSRDELYGRSHASGAEQYEQDACD